MTHTIGMISLGCAKNQVNAEHMLWLLRQAGYEISPDPDGAELVIVNTCGFIESAKTEAIDNILAMAQLKAEGRIQKILVTGCLAQRYQEEILQEMPEVDGVLGTGSYFDVANAVGQVLSGKRYKRFDDINADQSEDGRILTTPEYYAYLKIAEGCDNHCAYCIIPKLRGKLRSRPIEELVKEAEQLAADGVKELIVVAQDTSRYGLDLYGERKLAELLRQLCRIDGLVWIRVHYLYPDEMSQELIDVLANEPKIVKYLDIPIQHINDDILRRMNRRGNGEYVKELFTKLRREIPGLVLRTSLITGLPGEGEAEFAQLCDFLKEYKLERVGAFAFSPEEGTRAAEMEYPDTEIARQRADMVAEIQSRIMDDTTNRASARPCRSCARATIPMKRAITAGPLPTRRISTGRSGSRRKNISRPVTLPTSVWWTPMTVSLSVCWRKNTMTTASKITLVRVVLIPVYMVLMLLSAGGAEWLRWAAVAVFIIASVSDFLDGYIARHYNQVSDFGKFLDPLADKLLVTACMMIFVGWGRMPSWLVFIVIAREFAISGLRMVAANNGTVIAAGWSGKIKTSCTMVGLIAMMVLPNVPVLDTVVNVVILVTTVYSGVEYFVKNWHCLGLGKKA